MVFGKKTGFVASLNLSTLNGSNGFRLDGVAGFDESGSSVSGAGDVNGDGFGDLIIGAFWGRSEQRSLRLKLCGVRQEVGLCRNHRPFLAQWQQWLPPRWGSGLDPSGLSVSAAGDVNGDGFADLIVAPHLPTGTAPLQAQAMWYSAGSRALLERSPFPAQCQQWLPPRWRSRHGCERLSVSSAGDVNGDGFGIRLWGPIAPHRMGRIQGRVMWCSAARRMDPATGLAQLRSVYQWRGLRRHALRCWRQR